MECATYWLYGASMALSDVGLAKGQRLAERELDDAVHRLIRHAESIGMIPIAGVISRRVGDQHEVLGFGWNQLRAGIPGIHGETGAIIGMGRIRGGYGDLVATSSLSPCPFCQHTLALQMGIKEIRILDAINYTPDFSGYQRMGLSPTVKNHKGIAATFRKWVSDPANETIWARDIGLFKGKVQKPFDVTNRKRLKRLAEMAVAEAVKAGNAGEAPIGALVIDSQGEVLGAGHSQVKAFNDPSRVAAMSAWRACGAHDQWKDKTLLLTAGPDHIAYSMFHIFNFGQLIVTSDAPFSGRLDSVRQRGVPVTVWRCPESSRLLGEYVGKTKLATVREYFGADFEPTL